MDAELDFRLLFEASPDILLVLRPDSPRYTMVAATDARLQATHTTREATLGRGLFEVFPDNPDDPAATGLVNLRRSLERVLSTRAPDTMAVQKYDIRGPDGSFQVKYWSPKNLPIFGSSGQLRYILHRVEDVSELVQASEVGDELRGRASQMEREVIVRSRELATVINELRTANEKLEGLDRAKTAFFNNVSHEFRTPLTLILGPVENALAASNALADEDLAAVHRNAVRLLHLVNDLLDFSRITAGGFELAYTRTNLAELTAGLAGAFQSLVEDAGLKLCVDCPALPESVYVDPSRWEKIVLNLVSNAFKFTLEGEIRVKLDWRGDHVEFSVSDTGIGIPKHELPRIFERFHRVEGAKGQERGRQRHRSGPGGRAGRAAPGHGQRVERGRARDNVHRQHPHGFGSSIGDAHPRKRSARNRPRKRSCLHSNLEEAGEAAASERWAARERAANAPRAKPVPRLRRSSAGGGRQRRHARIHRAPARAALRGASCGER